MSDQPTANAKPLHKIKHVTVYMPDATTTEIPGILIETVEQHPGTLVVVHRNSAGQIVRHCGFPFVVTIELSPVLGLVKG